MIDINNASVTTPLERIPSRFSILSMLWSMHELARQRRDLQRLESHQLRDIGISQVDAFNEASRPVWDAPAHWK